METRGAARRLVGAQWWRSLLWSGLLLITGVMAVTTGEARWEAAQGGPVDSEFHPLWLLPFLGTLGLMVLVWWRRRWSWQVCVIGCAAAIGLWLDPTLALIGLLHVWRRCTRPVVGACTALVLLATFVATWRDTRGQSAAESFWRLLVTSDTEPPYAVEGPLSPWVAVLITLVAVVLFAGIGAVRRMVESGRATGEALREQTEDLGTIVAQQAERERIAREVHDALGHRLSVLSLHAGAIEAQAGSSNDPRLQQSASLVREAAARTTGDLQQLLAVLRRPDDPHLAAAAPGLADVRQLVDESVEHGMPLIAVIELDGVGEVDPVVGHTAYRVVQELLTNARRHAPGLGVRLSVSVRPAHGVLIEAANAWPSPRPLHEGSGLTGVRQRVAFVGGEAQIDIDPHGVLRTVVRLPWRSRDHAGGRS